MKHRNTLRLLLATVLLLALAGSAAGLGLLNLPERRIALLR